MVSDNRVDVPVKYLWSTFSIKNVNGFVTVWILKYTRRIDKNGWSRRGKYLVYFGLDMIENGGQGFFIRFYMLCLSLAISHQLAFVSAKGKTVDATQEMIALGVSNIFSSFFSSMPITGSFTRTAVNNASGVKTPLGGVFTGTLHRCQSINLVKNNPLNRSLLYIVKLMITIKGIKLQPI